MRLSKNLLSFLFLIHTFTLAEEKTKPFSTDQIADIHRYTSTLHRAFPGIKTCAFHFSGEALFAVFHDKAKRRLLITISPDAGTMTIKKNGTRQIISQLAPAEITIMRNISQADGALKPDPHNTSPLRVGTWLPFSLKDSIDIEGSIEFNISSTFSLNYHPDTGWLSNMGKPVFKKGAIKRADAYDFTEDILLDDIRKVLAKQKSCRVKLEGNRILTVTRETKQRNTQLEPIIVKVSDRIFINEKKAEEELENSLDLNNLLEQYVVGAKAAGVNPEILLRTTRKTDDKLFRETLNVISDLGIRHIELTPAPPANPPRKRAHTPPPRKP